MLKEHQTLLTILIHLIIKTITFSYNYSTYISKEAIKTLQANLGGFNAINRLLSRDLILNLGNGRYFSEDRY